MRWTSVCGLLAIVWLAGCHRAEPPRRSLVLSGSRSMAKMLQEMGDQFEAGHADVRIDIEATSTERAVSDTRQGLSDIGMLGRNLRPEETGFHTVPIGRDAVVLVVHRSNSIPGLTPLQVVSVFTSACSSWKEVGGSDRPISLIHQPEGRAIRELFREQFGLRPVQMRGNVAHSSEHVVAAVAQHPGSIGYASFTTACAALEHLPIRILPLGGMTPTEDAIRSGRYPLIRSLQLIARQPPGELVRGFLEFTTSPQGQAIVRKHGFVVLEP